MKPEGSAKFYQTLSSRVGFGHETKFKLLTSTALELEVPIKHFTWQLWHFNCVVNASQHNEYTASKCTLYIYLYVILFLVYTGKFSNCGDHTLLIFLGTICRYVESSHVTLIIHILYILRKYFTTIKSGISRLNGSLVPRRGGGGERVPGIHCLRMRVIIGRSMW